ncbi:nucleoside-diphosphate kinase [Patescibacteria group bacterium]|nr:nucleoside-diphosphate kinase [Patescibacteria group bacterium]MBU1673623.1 nucleoside-diphosphate kinase [Patescibacteria group bacterium]MBU1963889.1 nucleoside-diphosphate kinase [Patescibacteria group bacterium]
MERTLVITKPDALQRNLLGEIIGRLEKKGLKLVGMKMMSIDDLKVEEHYSHHVDKPFFASLKKFMQSSPVVCMVWEGNEAVAAVRLIAGETKGSEADAGTIRGDLSMSVQANVVHVSDSVENANLEVARFFEKDEIFDYKKLDMHYVYFGDDE